jgi:hypothetical protein
MVPHCSEFLIPVLHCCSAFVLNPALCLPCGWRSAKDQCVVSTHQNFSPEYRSNLLTCSPTGRNLSVVVRLLWSSEEFQSSLSRRVGNYTFDHTLGHSLIPPKSFYFLIHKRWCEYSLYSFSLHRFPKISILLSFPLFNCLKNLQALLLVSVSGY